LPEWNDPLESLEISLKLLARTVASEYKDFMQSITHHRAREAQQAAANREELTERIARAVPNDGTAEPLRGLHFARASARTERVHGVSRSWLCVIAQGAKEIYLGDDCFRYDPAHYFPRDAPRRGAMAHRVSTLVQKRKDQVTRS
jgi:hypothetical protein